MWGFIKDRLDEGSTYAGLAAIAVGFDKMGFHQAAPVAEALNQIASNPTLSGALIAVLGAFAVLKKEKGLK